MEDVGNTGWLFDNRTLCKHRKLLLEQSRVQNLELYAARLIVSKGLGEGKGFIGSICLEK